MAIPTTSQRFLDPHGNVDSYWRRWLESLDSPQSVEDLQSQVAAIQADLDAIGSPVQIIGTYSVSAPGSDGTYYLHLLNDQQEPGETYCYGTGPTGTKGWFAVADALDVEAGELTKTVGTDGVSTFGLEDVANSGNGALYGVERDAKGRITGLKPVVAGSNVTITDTGPDIEISSSGGGGGGGGVGFTTEWRQMATILGNTIQSTGITIGFQGSNLATTLSTTNVHTSAKRVESRAGITAAATGGFYEASAAYLWRGNAANLGGFTISAVGGPGETVTNASHRLFMGLTALASGATDVDPSSLANIVGLGYDAADTTVQIMHNDGSGTATKVDTTWPKPSINRSELFRIELQCNPGASSIEVRATRMSTGDVVTATLSTDLPVSTQFLRYNAWMSVGGVSNWASFVHVDYRSGP